MSQPDTDIACNNNSEKQWSRRGVIVKFYEFMRSLFGNNVNTGAVYRLSISRVFFFVTFPFVLVEIFGERIFKKI